MLSQVTETRIKFKFMFKKRVKRLTPEEFQKTYKEKEELTFNVILPFASIKDPRSIIGSAVHFCW